MVLCETRHIFACSSLTKLYPSLCNIVPHAVIAWTLLKSLSIEKTKLSKDAIHKVCSGSPALEFLKIYKCGGLNRLHITSASLRKLVIEDYWPWKKEDINLVFTSMEIFAPNVEALEILGHFGTKCKLVDVSSLVSAHIGFQLIRPRITRVIPALGDKYYRESHNMLRELLSNVQHVKKLTFGFWCLQYCRSDFLDLYEDKRKVSPTSEEKILNYCLLLYHLKTVKILGFHLCSEKQIMSLVELLLKNASVLETMVFVVSPNYCHHSEAYQYYDIVSGYNKDGLLKLSLKLLGFPRSSPLSKISLSGRCILERDDF